MNTWQQNHRAKIARLMAENAQLNAEYLDLHANGGSQYQQVKRLNEIARNEVVIRLLEWELSEKVGWL